MKVKKEASTLALVEKHCLQDQIWTSFSVKSLLNAFRIPLLLLIPAMNVWAGNYLAALICGMLSVGVWTWLSRPCPNPYHQFPDPSDLEEWF